MKAIKITTCVLFAAVALAGCNKEEPKVNDAKEYLRGVADSLKKSTDSVSHAVGGISEINSSELAFMGSNIGDDGSRALSVARSVLQRDGLDDDPFDSLNDLIDDYVANASDYGTVTESGGEFLFEPDTSLVCTDSETVQVCTDIVSQLSVLYKPTNDSSGSISVRFSSNPMAIIDYSPNSAAYTLVFDGIKDFADTAAPEESFPDTFSGRFKFAVEALSATEGRVTWSVPTAISVGDTQEDFMLNVDATSKLLQLTGDEQAGTGSVVVDIAGISAAFPVESEDSFTSDGTGRLSIPSLSATITGNSNQTLIAGDDTMAVDATLGAPGIVYSINGFDVLTIDNFTLNSQMTNGVMTYLADFVFDMALDNLNNTDYVDDVFTASVNIPQNTQLQETSDCGGVSGTNVIAGGPVAMTFTFNNATQVDISTANGSCFAD